MATKEFQISELLDFQPKSHRKAGDGLEIGKYPFFTSSQLQTKWFDEADYKIEAVILGTGGAPSVHCARSFSTSADVFILAPKSEGISARYVCYFLKGHKDILERGFKGAGLKHLSRDYTAKIRIPLPVDDKGNPNTKEQERIVAMLEEAEELKRKRAEADQKMNELVPALFIKMFGYPDDWPASFAMQPLGELVNLVSGGTPSTQKGAYWNGNVPWVSAKDMKVDFVSNSIDHITEIAVSDTNLKYIEPNSILIVVRGMILARYIPINLVMKRLTINQDIKAIVPKDKLLGIFLWAVLRCLSQRLAVSIKTAAHGTKKLDTADLLSFNIPVPQIILQNQFAEKVKEIEAKKEKQKQSAIQLDAIFASLLSRVLTL